MVATGICHGDRAVYLGLGQARGKHCDVLAVRGALASVRSLALSASGKRAISRRQRVRTNCRSSLGASAVALSSDWEAGTQP